MIRALRGSVYSAIRYSIATSLIRLVALFARLSTCFFFFFFFSSRRRHTRCLSDWSSDVCSSDLRRRAGRADLRAQPGRARRRRAEDQRAAPAGLRPGRSRYGHWEAVRQAGSRSEERRVGKECRGGWAGEGLKIERWEIVMRTSIE